MALDNYSDLKNSILSWMGRPGDVNIPVADMIELAETEMNRMLQTQNQLTFATITTVNNTQSYNLPNDFNSVFEVKITSTNPITVLFPMPPTELDLTYDQADDLGTPRNYSIIGNKIYLGQVPNGAFSVQLLYYGNLPALSDSTTTNWMLTKHPDAYLWTSLKYSEIFLGGDSLDERHALFEQRSVTALNAVKQQDIRAKAGGTPVTMSTYLKARDRNFP